MIIFYAYWKPCFGRFFRLYKNIAINKERKLILSVLSV